MIVFVYEGKLHYYSEYFWGGEGAGKKIILSSADCHLSIFDEETRAMPSRQNQSFVIKAWAFWLFVFSG